MQRSIFTAHVKVKHLNQQQKCPEAGSGCPFVTGYENNMRAHLKLVHKWEEITCMIPDCTFKTVVDQKMQDHLTKVHNARYDEATHALVCFAWTPRINASSACNKCNYLHRFYPNMVIHFYWETRIVTSRIVFICWWTPEMFNIIKSTQYIWKQDL